MPDAPDARSMAMIGPGRLEDDAFHLWRREPFEKRFVTSHIVCETPGGTVGQPVGVEMVFRHIDAGGSLFVFSTPLLDIQGSPQLSLSIRSGQGKRRGLSNSSPTHQTVAYSDPTLASLERGATLSVPSRLLGAKSLKTGVLR